MRQATYNYGGCEVSAKAVTLTSESGETQQGWVLTVVDPHEPAQHLIAIDTEVRDRLMRELTGGIIPASELPKPKLPTMSQIRGR